MVILFFSQDVVVVKWLRYLHKKTSRFKRDVAFNCQIL